MASQFCQSVERVLEREREKAHSFVLLSSSQLRVYWRGSILSLNLSIKLDISSKEDRPESACCDSAPVDFRVPSSFIAATHLQSTRPSAFGVYPKRRPRSRCSNKSEAQRTIGAEHSNNRLCLFGREPIQLERHLEPELERSELHGLEYAFRLALALVKWAIRSSGGSIR